jgi:phthalate 4,5-cis-dihydrodiol dehydrogenase
MIDAARKAGVALVVGPSHGFDAPVLRARAIVESGRVGRARMLSALAYTDFLMRPRRPEELDTARGGGVVFGQAAHQIDMLRWLGGGLVASVRARTGTWDAARPTEGAYAALLNFADGAFATAVYGGYGRFDSDEFAGWIGELGARRDKAAYGAARAALRRAGPRGESGLRAARGFGAPGWRAPPAARFHEHFGTVVVSCERADLRPLPTGVMVYGDAAARLVEVRRPAAPRATVIDELHGAAVLGRAPGHDGAWGMATLEVCLALLRSAREGREIRLRHQVATPPARRQPPR